MDITILGGNVSSEINLLSHLKIEKGSIIVLQSDNMNSYMIDALRKAIEFMDLDFKVPIFGMTSDTKISLAKRDEIVRQLDQLVDKEEMN